MFGAVDYARGLGSGLIIFGWDDKPLFISGLNDDARKVTRTLECALGADGYAQVSTIG